MSKQRGNILITALFMAIFLFFLCVALVSQNRMNISLGLSVDHRLKAESAARSGLTSALETMRNNPDWEVYLKGRKTDLDSGASFEVTVEPHPSPDGSPYLLKVNSTGVSGIVRAEHWAILEEVNLPIGKDGSGTPYLFHQNPREDSRGCRNRLSMARSGGFTQPQEPISCSGRAPIRLR